MFVKSDFWDVISGAETFESYITNILPEFIFKPEVPEEVVKSFRIVQKLLEYSYYEYDFIDPAFTKTFTSLEMALRIRFNQICPEAPKKSFRQLLLWFKGENYLEEVEEPFIQQVIVYFRNSQAHSDQHFGGGWYGVRVIGHCIDIINDLYEDKELRTLRIGEMRKLNKGISNFVKEGALIKIKGREINIFDAGILFVNNLDAENKEYYGFYKPVFDFSDNRIRGTTFLFKATDIEVTQNEVRVCDKYHGPIIISTLTSVQERVNYEQWIEEFKKSQHFQFHHFDSELGKERLNLRRMFHRRTLSTI